MRIDRCLIDANWGQSTDVVYQFCRQIAASRASCCPATASTSARRAIPFSEYKRKRGDRVGPPLADPERPPASARCATC